MRICLIPLKTEPVKPVENVRHFITRLDQVRPLRPDLLCLPECSFTGYLYEEERQVYLDAVGQAGVLTAITNTLETGPEATLFGGALIVDARGELLAESPHGTDEILIFDID